jgi:MtN3 and saliva related transmembrane protein
MRFASWIGLLAGVLTSVSYIPQIVKIYRTHEATDISWRTYLILAAGVGLWVLYGIVNSDNVIVVTNSVGLLLIAIVLTLKVRYRRHSDGRENTDSFR